MEFPSPIYGASFKLSFFSFFLTYNNFLFPSPIYGASFKLNNLAYAVALSWRFRPLYTGLVSNRKQQNLLRLLSNSVSVPYIRG